MARWIFTQIGDVRVGASLIVHKVVGCRQSRLPRQHESCPERLKLLSKLPHLRAWDDAHRPRRRMTVRCVPERAVRGSGCDGDARCLLDIAKRRYRLLPILFDRLSTLTCGFNFSR
jgi:hypothetical protein